MLKTTKNHVTVEDLIGMVPLVLMFASDMLIVQLKKLKAAKLFSSNNATIGVLPWILLMKVLTVLIGNQVLSSSQKENQLPFITYVTTKDKKLTSPKTNLVLKILTTICLLAKESLFLVTKNL